MRHNTLPFLIPNHPIIILPLNENPRPRSQKVNCGPIMPGHILFLTALPSLLPPFHDLAPPCHLSLYFCFSSTKVVRKRSDFFCFRKQTVLGMITTGSLVDWISQDVRSCRNSTASKVYKEERLYFPRLRTWPTSLYWWEPGEKKVKGIQKKGKCGEKHSTRSVDKAIGVRRQGTTRTPTLG